MSLIKTLLKGIAKNVVLELIETAKKDHREQTIKLVKHPGDKDAEELNIDIEFHCADAYLPLFLCKIVETAAKVSETSFNDMINNINVIHELMPDVASTDIKMTGTKKRVEV